MSDNAPGVAYASVVRMVPGAPTTSGQVTNLANYLTKGGTVTLERSERYLGAPLLAGDIPQMAIDWEHEAGIHPDFVRGDGTRRPIATHIVASLPAEYNSSDEERRRAKRTLKAFAHEMFGSGRNGGQWEYFSAFHIDRGHPHLHIVVNRMSHEGRRLKISRRDPFMNYDNMRAVMADVAYRHGIDLDARTRAERGIIERPITFAEYRRQMRANREHVGVYPQPETNTPHLALPLTHEEQQRWAWRHVDGVIDTLQDPEPILRANPGQADNRRRAAEAAAQAMVARLRARDIGAAAAARARLEAALDADDDFDPPGPGDDDPGPFDGGPGGGGNDDDDDQGGAGAPLPARGRPRQAREPRSNNVMMTRGRARHEAAQAALREAQEAARQRVDAENRRRERERRRRELAEHGPNVETRARQAARLARDRMQLRSGRAVDHGVTNQGGAGGPRMSRNDRNNRHR